MNRLKISAPVAAYPKAVRVISYTLALLLFSLSAVFADVPLFPYIVIVAFFVFAAALTLTIAEMVLLALPALVGFLALPAAGLALFYAAIGTIALTLAAVRQKMYLVFLAVPAAYGIAFAVTGDLTGAAGVLIFALPTLVMGVCFEKNAKRGSIIVLGTASLLLLLAGAVAAFLYAETGAVSLAALKSILTAVRDALIPEMLGLFAEMGTPVPEELLTEALNTVILLLPAIAVIVCETIAYFGSMLAVALISAVGIPLPAQTSVFLMEPVSAIVFLVAGLVTLFAPADSIVGPIAHSLYMILLPGLAVGKIYTFCSLMYVKQNRTSPLLFFFLLIPLGCIMPDFFAILGAFGLIKRALPPRNPSATS